MTTQIDKVGIATIRGNTLLLVRKRGTELLLMPGGRQEPGESATETLKREIGEETGGQLRADTLRFVGTFRDAAANDPGCVVSIALYTGEIEGTLAPHSEIDKLRWWNAETEAPDELSPIVKNHIVPYLIGCGLLRSSRGTP